MTCATQEPELSQREDETEDERNAWSSGLSGVLCSTRGEGRRQGNPEVHRTSQ